MHPRKRLMAYGLVISALWLPAGYTETPASGAAASPAQTAGNSHLVMHLGKVTVRGEKQIIATLQAIKVALNQPNSGDPRLANVVVCRIRDKMGSHLKLLTCATNRDLNTRRSITQTAMTEAMAGELDPLSCGTGSCYQQVFEPLNGILAGQPFHVLRVPVNAGALRALLAKVPLPAPRAATPAVGKTEH